MQKMLIVEDIHDLLDEEVKVSHGSRKNPGIIVEVSRTEYRPLESGRAALDCLPGNIVIRQAESISALQIPTR